MSNKIVLLPDSSELFKNGLLQEHNFEESSFEPEDFGTPVSEFDLTTADTSKVTNTSRMFQYSSSLNQDISDWDMSNVEDMREMFENATSFDKSCVLEWDLGSIDQCLSAEEFLEACKNVENRFDNISMKI